MLTPDLSFNKIPPAQAWRWIVDAFYIVRRQPLTWALLGLAYLVLGWLLGLAPLVGEILSMIASPVFAAGVILTAQQSEQGDEIKVVGLFAGFKEAFQPLLLVGLLYAAILVLMGLPIGVLMQALGVKVEVMTNGLPVVQGATEAKALALLVFSVLIFLASLTCWFAPALVVWGKLAPVAAMRLSFAAGLANWVTIFTCGILLAVLLVLAILPLGLGLLLWFPVLYVTSYTSWKSVFAQPLVLTKA